MTKDKELLDKLKLKRLNLILLRNSEIKTKKTNIKEKINTSKSSLDLILKKIKEKIALIEIKLIKVNKLNINIANIILLI
jgi:hypothetical protein